MKKTDEIRNTEDVIDSRDVIARIEYLESVIEDCASDPDIDDDTSDEQEELEALKALAEEGEGSTDWAYGEALINESYFTKYTEELCKDIGDIPSELPWYIANHIDWDGVAEEIKLDYMEVSFAGATYYIRSA